MKDMKKGDTYMQFGCKWIVDDIYKLTDEYMKEHNLNYRTRIHAHVIEAPADYIGIREMDSGYSID